MRQVNHKIHLSVLLFFSLVARADICDVNLSRFGWDEGARQWAAEWNAREPLFRHGNTMSMWAAVRSAARIAPTRAIEQKIIVQTPHFEKTLEISVFSPQSKPSGPLPLIFYIGPIFDDASSGNSDRFIREVTTLGYRVAFLPNPTSAGYIALKPTHPLGDLTSEGAALLDTMRQLKARIGEENIRSIELAGRSYGGFMAAVVAALDREYGRRIFDGPMTIFSPTNDRKRGIEMFDRILDSSSKPSIVKKSVVYGNLLFARSEANLLPHISPELIDGLYAHDGFKPGIVELVKEVALLRNFPAPSSREARSAWETQLRFSHVDDQFADHVESKPPGADSISYWLGRASRHSPLNLRILTTKDDFLANPEFWDDRTFFEYNPQNLILLDWGGHLGFEETRDWKRLLRLAFP